MKYSARLRLTGETERIIAKYKKAATLNALAMEFGTTSKTIREILTDAGVQIRSQGGQRSRTLNEHFFERVDSEEKAYWIGFLLADGCISQTGSALRLIISLTERDISHLGKLQIALSSNHMIKENRACVTLSLSSKKLCNDLIKLNITPRKTYNGKPAKVPTDLKRHYFRGLVDGDGSISRNKTYLGYSLRLFGTKDIVTDFSRWLGCRGRLVYQKRQQAGCVFSLSDQQKVVQALESLYSGATVYLDRKYERYQKAIERWYSMPKHSFRNGKWVWEPKQLRLQLFQ